MHIFLMVAIFKVLGRREGQPCMGENLSSLFSFEYRRTQALYLLKSLPSIMQKV